VKKTLYRYLPGTSVKPPAIIKPAQNSIIIDLGFLLNCNYKPIKNHKLWKE